MKESQTQIAAKAHTNLNVFAVIVSILESGCVYPVGFAHRTAQQIIKLCDAEQIRQLRLYDEAVERSQSDAI